MKFLVPLAALRYDGRKLWSVDGDLKDDGGDPEDDRVQPL
jgi:hypothetical protein